MYLYREEWKIWIGILFCLVIFWNRNNVIMLLELLVFCFSISLLWSLGWWNDFFWLGGYICDGCILFIMLVVIV